MPEKLIMVRESEWRQMREALSDIASGSYSGVLLTSCPPKDPAVERARRALSHPTPGGFGREGKHQWGGPERDREVCVNCGATRVLEGGSAGEPVAWWVHDLHVARQPVKARARYPEPTEFLYPASQEQDARNAAKMLGGKCTPLFAHPALTAGKPEQEGR